MEYLAKLLSGEISEINIELNPEDFNGEYRYLAGIIMRDQKIIYEWVNDSSTDFELIKFIPDDFDFFIDNTTNFLKKDSKNISQLAFEHLLDFIDNISYFDELVEIYESVHEHGYFHRILLTNGEYCFYLRLSKIYRFNIYQEKGRIKKIPNYLKFLEKLDDNFLGYEFILRILEKGNFDIFIHDSLKHGISRNKLARIYLHTLRDQYNELNIVQAQEYIRSIKILITKKEFIDGFIDYFSELTNEELMEIFKEKIIKLIFVRKNILINKICMLNNTKLLQFILNNTDDPKILMLVILDGNREIINQIIDCDPQDKLDELVEKLIK